MSISRQQLPQAESPSPLADIVGGPTGAEDFGSNALQQELLLAQVITTDDVKGGRPKPAPRPTPRPRPNGGIRRA